MYGTERVERDGSGNNLPWNERVLCSRVHLLKRVDAVLYIIASKYALLVRIVNYSRYLIARALKISQLIPPILIHLTLDHEGRSSPITIKLANSLFDILLTLLRTEEQPTIPISQFYLVINSLVH